MKLYYSSGSCSLTPRILMNLLGIEAEYIKIVKKKNEQGILESYVDSTNELYKNVNSKGSIPMLELADGTRISETAVILQYIADSNKAYNLLPEVGNKKRYEVLQWLNYVATELHKGIGGLFHKDGFGEAGAKKLEEIAKSKLVYLNEALAGKEYVVDSFSISDAYMFVVLSWTQKLNVSLDEYSNIKSYYNRILKIEAVAKSTKDDGSNYQTV